MTSFSRYQAFFFTKEVVNKGFDANRAQTTVNVDARIKETFRSSLVTKADDYVLAVERFEISTNGVPMYEAGRVLLDDGFVGAESIIIRNTPALGGAERENIQLTKDTYSLPDTVKKVTSLMSILPADASNALVWTVDSEGFVHVKLNPGWLALYRLDLSNAPLLNMILGIDYSEQHHLDQAAIPATELISPHPRFDCGDALDHLRITSNLPVVSDTIGQSKSNVLTDLSFPSVIGAGYGYNGVDSAFTNPSVSYTQRQNVVYTPAERRYLNFRSSAPIDDIEITAEYVRPDGSSAIIQLPTGSSFTIKLGFFLRQ